MLYYVTGKLALLQPSCAVIDVGGVGYKLTISQNTFGNLSRKSNESSADVTLYTYMAVREDGIELFGFDLSQELDAFKLLITVSGVGPKAAVSILSQLTPSRLTAAILSDNKKAIAQANGIGPKTAARIILELKDKLKKAVPEDFDTLLGDDVGTPVTAATSSKLSDALEALMALGYSRNEALSALKSIDTENAELDDIIRLALKKIMK